MTNIAPIGAPRNSIAPASPRSATWATVRLPRRLVFNADRLDSNSGSFLRLARQFFQLARARGQFRRALLYRAFQVLIQLRQALLARPDFARHLLETARQFAQFVAALRQFAQHLFLEVSLLDGGGGARQIQQRMAEPSRDEGDDHHHAQQPGHPDEGGADGQLAHGRENGVLFNVKDNLPAGQR